MKITLNRKMILVAGCLVLVACAGEIHAQHETPLEQNTVKEHPASLGQRCKQLSSETGEDYQVVSGRVIKYGVVPPKPSECFEGDCSWLSETSAYYVMTDVQGVEVDNEFYVYTEPEQRDELLKKNQDMQDGKKYEFCAKKINTENNQDLPERLKSKNLYKIDFVETIHEITLQKRPYHLDLLEHMKDSPAYPGLDKEYERQLKNWEVQKGGEDGK